MINNEIQNTIVHHGARYVSSKFIIKILPGIENIKTNIDQFKKAAFKYNKMTIIEKQPQYNSYFLATEKFNNTISILGQRGTGKTSAMMTLLEEIENNTYFEFESKTKNQYDIINKILNPEEMGEGSDILGWIITTLENYVELYLKEDENINNKIIDIECLHNISVRHDVENLKEQIDKLRISYIASKKEYANLMNANSSSLHEYNQKVTKMLSEDYNFHENFNKFISNLVNFKRKQNGNSDFNDEEKEPLIYFFFDDVDISSKHCANILMNILNFLCHPNIVVFISGDYDVFEKSMIKYFLNFTNYPQKEVGDEDIEASRGRSECFLKKVLPPTYRYRIIGYTNEILFNLKYNENSDTTIESKFQNLNILQLISYVFGIGFKDCDNIGGYLESFVIPDESIDDVIDIENNFITNNTDLKNNYIYAYLSVFGKSARSYMNVYNYLYTKALEIYTKIKYKKEKIEVNKYWDGQKFSEFVNIILESKYSYSVYHEQINNFLKFRYDQIEDSILINNIRNLRIDCEELKTLITNILEEDSKPLIDNKQLEVDSLIMLPILINEIFYNIHRNDYKTRYESVSKRLKNILCNVIINSLNKNVQIIPTNLGMRRTLCIYYRIMSRLTFDDLKDLGKTSFDLTINEFYISNAKKYVRQLYYATILLHTSKITNKQEISEIKYRKLYDLYEKSTFAYVKEEKKSKENLEKIIHQLLKNFFIKNDLEWFNNFKTFSNNINFKYNYVYDYTINKYLDKIKNCKELKIENKLESLYYFIDRVSSNEEDLENNNLDKYILLLYFILKNKNLSSNVNQKKQFNSYNIGISKNDLEKLIKYMVNTDTVDKLTTYANDIFSKLKKYEKIILNGDVWNKWKSNSDFKMELIKILYKFTSEYEKNLNRNYSEDKCKEIENTQMKGDILEKYFEIYFLIVFILSYLKIKMTVNNYFFNSLNKDLDS